MSTLFTNKLIENIRAFIFFIFIIYIYFARERDGNFKVAS